MAFENDPEGYRIASAYAGTDFDKPRNVTIEAFCEYGSSDWTLADFLKMIQAAIATIPADKQESAIVDLKGGYDESTKLAIRYEGPESAETVADRVRRCEEYVASNRASERATYEALKKKFG